MLNGAFVFQMGALDQGYWPDGIYTAPTDEALRSDLTKLKELGFNLVRKHMKVEPQRWYYWADRIGLMVWQDMPSTRTGNTPDEAGRSQFENELRRIIDDLKSSPSIVTWVPFNEGWGEYDPGRIADDVKRYDPSRLVSNHSGSNCCGFDGGNGDFIDDHVYVGPGTTMPSGTRAAALGEYGGLGLAVPDHQWNPGASFSYENQASAEALLNRYVGLVDTLREHMRLGLSVAIYTELTDVETEVNGIFSYDRQVQKMPRDRLSAAHYLLISESRTAPMTLPLNRLISLQVTTPGYTDRFLRHAYGLASTEVITGGSDDLLRQDGTFWIRSGLADPACISFESRNYPGSFLRHQDLRLGIGAQDGSAPFLADATFCPRGSNSRVRLESYNLPGAYVRHYNAQVYVARNGGPNPWDAPALFDFDTTWDIVRPWWRSGVDLRVGEGLSLRVTTPGLTDRYLRHQYGLARTDVVSLDSSELLKHDATFIVRRGLADGSCYSLESSNYPGSYLRHAYSRVRLDSDDNSSLFFADATFCAQPAENGAVTMEASNIPGSMRHYYEEVYVATNDASQPWDNPVSYVADTTWAIAAPWISTGIQSTQSQHPIP